MKHGRRPEMDKGSVVFSWLFSYIVVFLVPIALSIGIFWHSGKALEQQVDVVNSLLVSNAATTLDDSFKEIFDTASHVMINPSLQVISRSDGPIVGEEYERLDRAMREVRALVDGNDFITDYYVILNKNGYIFNKSSLYSPDNPELFRRARSKLTGEEWEWICSTSQEGFGFLGEGRFLYIRDMVQLGEEHHLVRLVFFLNDSLVLRVVNRIKQATTMGFILADPSDKVLYATSAFAEENAPTLMQALKDGKKKVVIDKENYLLIPATSTYGFRFLFVEHQNVVYDLMTDFRWLFFVTLCICLVIGGLIVRYFTRRNYRSLHSLMAKASEKLGMTRDLSGNEYGILLATMDLAAERLDSADVSLRENRETLRTSALVHLLHGTESPEGLSSVELSRPYQSVALCRVVGRTSHSEFQNRCQVVRRILGTLRLADCTVVEIDEMFCILIGAENGDDPAWKESLVLAEQVCNRLNAVPGIDVAVSLGNIHKGVESLDLCFTEASEAMEYRIIYGSRSVIAYRNLANVVSTYSYPPEAEQSLINFIKRGDSVSARKITQDLLRHNIREQVVSPQIARCFMFELISTIIKALDEVTLDQHFLNEEKPVDRMLGCETLPQTERTIDDIIEVVCERISDRYEETEGRTMEEVRRYIDEHFDDSQLCLDQLSDLHGISSVSLSRKYRSCFGISVSQYINQKRLDLARSLLHDTDERIASIAIRCGFASAHTFIRVFKKYEGVTPGQYRQTTSA
jgi:AraC-like DNA-binding protein